MPEKYSREEILTMVKNQLGEILEIDPSSVNESDSYVDDLNADSFALIELVEALEEELGEKAPGFRIEDEDLEDLMTVRDSVDYIFDKVNTD